MTYAVVGIISRKNDKGDNEYLLVSSKRDFGEFTGRYYPPGGHLEQGEDEKSALVREIKEELNLDVEPVERIAETGADIKDQTTYWWRCEVRGGELMIDKKELADVGWFTREQIGKLAIWPMVKKVFDQHIFLS